MNFITTATSTLTALACFVVLYVALLRPQQVRSLSNSALVLLHLCGVQTAIAAPGTTSLTSMGTGSLHLWG